MTELAVSRITDADVPYIVALWQRAGLTRPWNDPTSDIAFARRGANATILIGRSENKIAATAMVGHDGHRGWVYYVAVDPDQKCCGDVASTNLDHIAATSSGRLNDDVAEMLLVIRVFS